MLGRRRWLRGWRCTRGRRSCRPLTSVSTGLRASSLVHAGAGMSHTRGVERCQRVEDAVGAVVGGVVVAERDDIDAGVAQASGVTRRRAKRVGLDLLHAALGERALHVGDRQVGVGQEVAHGGIGCGRAVGVHHRDQVTRQHDVADGVNRDAAARWCGVGTGRGSGWVGSGVLWATGVAWRQAWARTRRGWRRRRLRRGR